MDNRERLLQAAVELFREQGYAHTSVEDLLSRTGVARSNFYYHFDSKLDLAREITSRWADSYRDGVVEAWERAESSPERRRLLLRSLRGGDAPEPDGRPTAALVLALAPHDPDIRATLSRVVDDLQGRVAALFGDDDGAPDRGDGEPSPVTGAAVSALVGSLVVGHAFDDSRLAHRAGDGLDRLLSACRAGDGCGPKEGALEAGAPGEPSSTTASSPMGTGA